MLLEVNKEEFLEKLTPMIGIASTKNALTSLEGVLIDTSDGENVVFTAYDMKKGMVSKQPAVSIRDGGKYIMPAQRLSQIIRLLPDETFFIEIDEKMNTTVYSGSSRFSIFSVNGDNYPLTPEFHSDRSMVLPSSVLRDMLSRVQHSISAPQDIRPMLCGAYFVLSRGHLKVVSCDSFTLSICECDCEMEDTGVVSIDQFDFILPGSAVSDLLRILPDSDEKITVNLARKHAIFMTPDLIFFTRFIEENYIDYERIVPRDQEIFVEVDRVRLLEGLERANLVAEDKSSRSFVRLSVCDGVFSLSCRSVSGMVYDEVPCTHEGANLEIAFNCRYLINSVRAANSERLRLSFKGKTQSLLIEAVDQKEGDSFLYMVLPVRTQ